MKKIKNIFKKVLKVVNGLMVIITILCVLSLDSDSMIPTYIGLISGFWCLCVAIIKDSQEDDEGGQA